MRLFVAVDLAERARAAAGAIVAELAARLSTERLLDRGSIAWVLPANLHVTLRFLGEVGKEAASALVDAIGAPFEQERFAIELRGVGLFPAQGAPRVLWIGIEDGRVMLEDLQREVEQRVARLGLPVEDRPFAAHLTLARFKHLPSPRLRDRLGALAGPAVAGKSPVDHVTLYQSELSLRGPDYRVLARGPLTGGRSSGGAPPS